MKLDALNNRANTQNRANVIHYFCNTNYFFNIVFLNLLEDIIKHEKKGF